MADFVKEYTKRVANEHYYGYFKRKYRPFIDKIKEIAETNTDKYTHPDDFGIAEFGCGIANTTKVLLDETEYRSHYCYDIHTGMIALASKNVRHGSTLDRINTGHCKVLFHRHDIKKPMPHRKYFMVHSHGVLEHFSDEDIVKTVSNILDVTDKQVHYVPSHVYREPSFGDERLMTPQQWYDILKDFNARVYEFNDEYDLCIVIKK